MQVEEAMHYSPNQIICTLIYSCGGQVFSLENIFIYFFIFIVQYQDLLKSILMNGWINGQQGGNDLSQRRSNL